MNLPFPYTYHRGKVGAAMSFFVYFALVLDEVCQKWICMSLGMHGGGLLEIDM